MGKEIFKEIDLEGFLHRDANWMQYVKSNLLPRTGSVSKTIDLGVSPGHALCRRGVLWSCFAPRTADWDPSRSSRLVAPVPPRLGKPPWGCRGLAWACVRFLPRLLQQHGQIGTVRTPGDVFGHCPPVCLGRRRFNLISMCLLGDSLQTFLKLVLL